MYRKITQEKLLKRYKCFQAPMDIMYSLLGQHLNKAWLRELENSFYGIMPRYKRPQIIMHFIQKLQGGNNNGTY